ncbi:hypothetical protein ACFL1H_01015 [Nanoarchaeota archaeon]
MAVAIEELDELLMEFTETRPQPQKQTGIETVMGGDESYLIYSDKLILYEQVCRIIEKTHIPDERETTQQLSRVAPSLTGFEGFMVYRKDTKLTYVGSTQDFNIAMRYFNKIMVNTRHKRIFIEKDVDNAPNLYVNFTKNFGIKFNEDKKKKFWNYVSK